MNLKESFQYQNFLTRIEKQALAILHDTHNLMEICNITYRSKVDPDSEDEVTYEEPSSEFAGHIDQVVAFLLDLLVEKQKLADAIVKTKQSLDFNLDSEISLNTRRHELAAVLNNMTALKNSETTHSKRGVGYRFNQDGEQVSYRCDLKTIQTINFDRDYVKQCRKSLASKSDEASKAIDACLVTSEVDYQPLYDVNDSFDDIFTDYLNGLVNND